MRMSCVPAMPPQYPGKAGIRGTAPEPEWPIHQLMKLSSAPCRHQNHAVIGLSHASLRVHQEWPIGGYGGEPTASGFQKHFLECGKELARLGRLDTDVRRQLFGVELTHPEALALRA